MTGGQAIVILATKGSYTSKPRPCVVIQADSFLHTDSLTLCLMTSARVLGASMLRIDVEPNQRTARTQPDPGRQDRHGPAREGREHRRASGGRHMRRLEEAVQEFLDLDR